VVRRRDKEEKSGCRASKSSERRPFLFVLDVRKDEDVRNLVTSGQAFRSLELQSIMPGRKDCAVS